MGAIDPFVGRLVDGRYEILARIARGGMATVYLAMDRRLEREVALKVMHPHLAEDAAGVDFKARFRREARAAARLTHPGLVAVYDQGLDGETTYLTMEYVAGGNLRRRLRQQGSLSVGEALDLADAVLDPLAAVHRAGLVHRDVKPENVLLADDGRVKLADFGLARAVTEVTATTTGTMMGTAAYLAPELVVRGEADARTDVYAVGIVLYEMLTGQQPFSGESAMHVAYQHVHEGVPAPSDLLSALPSEVDELVGALTARQSDDRPLHAGAALALLRRTRAELDPASLELRRPVAAVALAGGGSGGGPGRNDDDPDGSHGSEPGDEAGDETTVLDADERGSTVALPIGLGVRDVTVVPPTEPHRRRWPVLVALVALLTALGGGAWWWFAAGPGAYTTVPDVAGRTLAEATDLLDRADLKVTSSQANDAQVPKDAAISSSPGKGERVRRGIAVDVVISLGPVMVTVPEGLVGATKADAEAALTTAQLKVAWGSPAYDDHAPVDTVLTAQLADGQDAAAGTSVAQDSTITLVLSQGPAPVELISVLNATLETAKTDLARDALSVSATEDYSDTVPQGQIISQNPAAGETVYRGDTIDVVVSKGPQLFEVPDVLRSGVSGATKTLEEAGFVVKTQKATAYFGLGIVIGQSPEGRSMQPKGTTIVLTYT